MQKSQIKFFQGINGMEHQKGFPWEELKAPLPQHKVRQQ